MPGGDLLLDVDILRQQVNDRLAARFLSVELLFQQANLNLLIGRVLLCSQCLLNRWMDR